MNLDTSDPISEIIPSLRLKWTKFPFYQNEYSIFDDGWKHKKVLHIHINIELKWIEFISNFIQFE